MCRMHSVVYVRDAFRCVAIEPSNANMFGAPNNARWTRIGRYHASHSTTQLQIAVTPSPPPTNRAAHYTGHCHHAPTEADVGERGGGHLRLPCRVERRRPLPWAFPRFRVHGNCHGWSARDCPGDRAGDLCTTEGALATLMKHRKGLRI